MKAEDLRNKTPDELTKLLLETRKNQMNMRFQRSGGQLEKTHDMRIARRTIARIKTFLNAGVVETPKAKPAKKTTKAKAATKTKKKDQKDAA